MVTITAHMSKITGIDWSYQSEHELLSCSQDKTVKVSATRCLTPVTRYTTLTLLLPVLEHPHAECLSTNAADGHSCRTGTLHGT